MKPVFIVRTWYDELFKTEDFEHDGVRCSIPGDLERCLLSLDLLRCLRGLLLRWRSRSRSRSLSRLGEGLGEKANGGKRSGTLTMLTFSSLSIGLVDNLA